MRLIDADALKKYMDDCGWCDNCPDKKRLCEMDCRFPDFCTHEWQRVIDEQPTIHASPWHRVEEGLPPKATWVLTIATDGNVKLFNIATVDAGGQWWTCSPQNILRELYGVRYWMPIEPPKEDT